MSGTETRELWGVVRGADTSVHLKWSSDLHCEFTGKFTEHFCISLCIQSLRPYCSGLSLVPRDWSAEDNFSQGWGGQSGLVFVWFECIAFTVHCI